MDNYIKIARVYPSIVGAVIPFILTVMCCWNYLPYVDKFIYSVLIYIGYIGVNALIFAALAYLLREIVRNTSKIIFQIPLFNEDETEMPTTKLLLWSENRISKTYHKEIERKIKQDFGIQLFSANKELQDLHQAKMIIVNVVQQMREVTRNNAILLQYNYEYGFCRNYLGASVLSVFYLVLIWISNIWFNMLPWWCFAICIGLQIVAMLIAVVFLRYVAQAYAKQLISAYMNT